MKIDINKKYRTRDGQQVTQLMRVPTGSDCLYPWTGVINGEWETWTDDGLYSPNEKDGGSSLVEIREPREWKASVSRADGKIYTYNMGDENYAVYEVVRVREIID